jgi:hypothetical protein
VCERRCRALFPGAVKQQAPSQVGAERENNMNSRQKELTEDQYEEMLTEIYGVVDVCGYKFDAGRVLRELDPTAFRCGMADEPEVFVCGECDAEYDNETDAEECCKP